METQGTLVDLAPRRQAEQRYWLGQRLATVGKPLLVGLPLLALILAVTGYFVVDAAWRVRVRIEWRRRQLRRAQQNRNAA